MDRHSGALSWHSATETHRGNRRKHNEDAVLALPSAGVWVVADGMGGHAMGGYAAEQICAALSDVTLGESLEQRVDQVEDSLLAVNESLRVHSRLHCQGATVGSTVVAMVADADVGVVLWAGDSRLYRLRNGRLEQITRDHNPAYELFESGVLSESEVLASDTNVITRAVGSQRDLALDVAVFDLEAHDVYLLCSDGLYKELPLEDVRALLLGDSAQRSVDRLLSACLRGEARDNVSVVVVNVGAH